MILIISGTNRPNSNTEIMAKYYHEHLTEISEEEVKLCDLNQLQDGLLNKAMYEGKGQSDRLKKAQDDYFIPANKWVILSPEYNGSYPGIVKLLFDALSVRHADKTFHNKKVALVGISSGRAGNWLGMDQLTSVLNYLKMNVFYNKLAINHISQVINEAGSMEDEKTKSFVAEQMKDFLEF